MIDVGYVDTSCLVAVAFDEPVSEAVSSWLASSGRLLASNLLESELRSAMAREGVDFDPRLVDRIGWVLPDRPLSIEMSSALAAGYLRGADLWHVSCALFVAPDPRQLAFLTLDRTQAKIATALGFTVPELESLRP